MKKIVITISLSVLLCVITFLCLINVKKNNTKQYIVFNDTLSLENEFYYKVEISLRADKLDQLLGYTTEGDQVYAIEGLDKKDWICLRNAGEEYIYRSARTNPITDFTLMDFSKLVIRDYNNIEVILAIDDEEIIQELKKQLIEENIVSGDIIATDIKNFSVFFKEYPTLEYECSYIIDQNGDHYFYDSYTDCTWKLNSHIFENE